MEKKTVGLIRFLKHHGAEYKDLRQAAIAYMSEYSGCKMLECYEHGNIEKIVFEIFLDLIDSVDRPSCLLRQIEESKKIHREYLDEEFSDAEAVLTGMMLIQVRSDSKYINGFKEQDFEEKGDQL